GGGGRGAGRKPALRSYEDVTAWNATTCARSAGSFTPLSRHRSGERERARSGGGSGARESGSIAGDDSGRSANGSAHGANSGQSAMKIGLFFGLAALAALNPKLLIVDLLLAGSQRPRAMFVCFLLGGMGLGLTVGLLDVLVLHADAIQAQNRASGGLDLALGIRWVAIGALLAADRLPRRRRPAPPPAAKRSSKLGAWAQRVLYEPHYALAVLIGAVVGTPGAAYLLMLHDLVSGKSPTAVQVVAVIVFVVINFALVIIPFAFYIYS